MINRFMGGLLLMACSACSPAPKITKSNMDAKMHGSGIAMSAPVTVYKTRKDYRRYVPVNLSSDKGKVVSYPDPKDLKKGNEYALPVILPQGYFWDRRGIGVHVAFLKWTYEEYAAMERAPGLEDLYAAIIDKDPLLELWQCGTIDDYEDPETELSRAISSGEFYKRYQRAK